MALSIWWCQGGDDVPKNNRWWRSWSKLYFIVLAFLITGPLLVPRGYILALDTAWGPHYVFNNLSNPASPSRVVISSLMLGLRTVLGAELAQSVFLLAILFLVGWGMYTALPIKRWAAKYFAGTLYLLNPFVYDRLMSGQWLLLLGYALLPFAVQALYRLMQQPGSRQALIVAAWWLAMTLCSFHYLFIFGLVFLVGWGIALLSAVDKRRVAFHWVAALGWYVLFNLFWLILALVSAGDAQFVDKTHAFTFATHSDILGSPWISVLWLQGFFGQKGVQLASQNPLVAGLFLPLIGLAVYGTVRAIKNPAWRDLTVTLMVSAYLAIVLAVGVASAGSRTFYLWLFDYLPGFTAMREPQKFVALLALFYAIFGAYGLVTLFDRFRQAWQRTLLVAIAAGLIVVQVLPMLNGVSGQLHRTDYPIGWYRVRDTINESPDGKILVLPWQLYFKLPFAYTDKVIANPAPAVFDRPTYVSRRVDVAGATEPPDRLIDEVADKIDHKKKLTEKDLRILRAYDIRWIVVLSSEKAVNAKELLDFPQVQERYRDPEIVLYELDQDN